ncbi:MAG: CTP synthase, partial [Draconibacterium sp.]|nr:CTP synthase [Draconibacterium sp.]
PKHQPDMDEWKSFLGRLKNPTEEVNIAVVGKYVELPDAYKSIAESFIHAGAANECKVNVDWISSETINKNTAEETLKKFDGVLVAPGFGKRGIEGKITAIKFIRENEIPFFGICLGMQCAVIEFSRNVLGLKGADSTEFDEKTLHPVIDLMEDQKTVVDKGGTMRLGAYKCSIKKGTKVHHAYGHLKIKERHRHRYEFNNAYKEDFEKAGMIMSGINPKSNLVEIVELKDHPWFVGTQFHPELKSTVQNPHPLFVNFVKSALAHRKNRTQ